MYSPVYDLFCIKFKKMTYRTTVSIFLFALLMVYSVLAMSTEISGVTAAGKRFKIEENSISSASNLNGVWGFLELRYKAEGQYSSARYRFPVQAPAVVKFNPIGMVVISEKIGGNEWGLSGCLSLSG